MDEFDGVLAATDDAARASDRSVAWFKARHGWPPSKTAAGCQPCDVDGDVRGGSAVSCAVN
jgi:hypothetical protein